MIKKIFAAFLGLALAVTSAGCAGKTGNGGKGGIQHVALRVDNIDAAIEELQEKGVKMIDKKARRGAGGADIAFIHPKSTGGILLEICELRDKREAY